ncbi:uncharacterized protein J3D65DRAFT_599864 [Phyllosticta citribraziliensis]|uniref:EthD domain-containing protein n=1 Tax=Phyllosticta citribraziliensis TaxID=989973 RepID=A0ABR1M4V8_9PEZI
MSSSTPITLTVFYPADPDATFDHDYYVNTHMPMAEKLWRPMGMLGYRTFKIQSPTPSGDAAPYSVVTIVEFSSAAAWEEAFKLAPEHLMPDIPNYSNKPPLFFVGERFGGSVGVVRE